MSAGTLRLASAAIREEWGNERGGAWSQVQAFHLAVADWLDAEAVTLENFEPLLDAVNLAYEKAGAPKAYLQFGRRENGEIQMRSDTSPAALLVARAYLGEDA